MSVRNYADDAESVVYLEGTREIAKCNDLRYNVL